MGRRCRYPYSYSYEYPSRREDTRARHEWKRGEPLMAAECSGRIGKELKECARDAEASGCTAEAVGGDMRHLRGTIKGPEGSPFEGGIFVVDIVVTEQYPFAPPKMKFETRVWHPNVSSQTGAICLDILKNEWSPALTVRTATARGMRSIIAISGESTARS